MRLMSWNVNGIRAVSRKGFVEWLTNKSPDILCVQETKANPEQLTKKLKEVPGFYSYWSSAEKKGYSGVAVYTKKEPLSIREGFGIEERFDREGRILVAEYEDFYLLNIYFPNGKKDEERLQFKLDFYDATLDFCEKLRKNGKGIILAGDFNTAHNEIDLARPKENENVSGFLRIERDWLDKIEKYDYKDTFRELNPEKTEAYTWWSYRTAARKRNVGWRLDYFYVTPDIMKRVKDAEILDNVYGSDHCPIQLTLK